MRLAIENKKWMALILVIGVVAASLSLVCTEGIHIPFLGTMDGQCLVMTHSAAVDAVLGSDSSHTLVPQLLVLAVGLAAFTSLLQAPARFVLVSASLSPPPDPRYGRLRL